MPDREAMAMWRTRLRWRLRGAWQWPTFVVVTAVDAVVLSVLPFAGDGADLFPAFLLAGFFNLAVVAVLAPVGGMLLRRRKRGSLPREIARDYAGTVALLALAAVLLAGGVIHRPAVAASADRMRVAVAAARAFVAHQGPARYQAGLGTADTWRQGADLFRTCFHGPDPRRDLCVFVRTDEPTPVVRRDPDQSPNSFISGADNPGRHP